MIIVEKLFSKEKAIETANVLNATDEGGWSYKAIHCPKGTGYSFIEIYDENGEYVGKL